MTRSKKIMMEMSPNINNITVTYGDMSQSEVLGLGCITMLGHFISRLGEHALPFFKLMKKLGTVQWTPEADAALQELKRYLALLPILIVPKPREPLLLYVEPTS
jgi:hypothetical protein